MIVNRTTLIGKPSEDSKIEWNGCKRKIGNRRWRILEWRLMEETLYLIVPQAGKFDDDDDDDERIQIPSVK